MTTARDAPAEVTVGVEEEYFLVDPVDRSVAPGGPQVVERAACGLGDLVSGEFSRCQVEVRTSPCAGAVELHAALTRVRAGACAAARAEGLRLCASGTPVLGGVDGRVGDHPRYRAGLDQYRAMLDDFAVCAQHTHVHLPDREAAVFVGNHLRPWLPLLVALSANSPFLDGRDTGYDSWRSVIRGRFSCLGPPPYAESLEQHERTAEAIAASEAMLDAALPFWDVRPNPRLPTLEIRTMDVPAATVDSVALAVLLRGFVLTALDAVRRGDPGPPVGSELLRASYWRSARDGWSAAGTDPLTGRPAPMPELGRRFAALARPALERLGDVERVRALLARADARGGGAARQRAAATPHGGRAGVVDALVARTEATDTPPVPTLRPVTRG